jgi:hypothetical protein
VVCVCVGGGSSETSRSATHAKQRQQEDEAGSKFLWSEAIHIRVTHYNLQQVR